MNFLSARTINLTPTATSHIDVARQSNGSYTGFEVANTPPYRQLAVIPQFEQQFAACLPHAIAARRSTATVAYPPGAASQLQVAALLPAGNYLVASTSSDSSTLHFDLFDPQHNLLSENNFAPGESFYGLTLADVNQDGIPDLIAVFEAPYSFSYHNGGVAVFLGNGDGTFQPAKQQVLAARATLLPVQSVAVADVNGDGKADLVLAAPYGGPLFVVLGNGDGTFSSQTLPVSINQAFASQVSVAMADLNGDGKIDLVLSTGTNGIAVAFGNGDGTFLPATQYAVASPANPDVAAASVAVGDLNGDGIPDIVTASGTILFGDGKGGFPTRQDYASTGTGSVMIGDIDGDGIPDLLFGNGNPVFFSGNSNDPSATVLFGSGNGAFVGAPVTSAPVALNVYNRVATADFNGDGLTDLAVATAANNLIQLTVFTGFGNGRFSPATPQTFVEAASYVPGFVIAADFNHDGKADLAVLLTGGIVQIYRGNGDQTFGSPLNVKLPDQNLSAIAAPDLNGDGIPDLVAWSANNIFVFLGKGDGTFSAQTFTSSVASPAITFGDFNGDRKLDLVIANATQTTLTILLGQGDGTFPNAVTTNLPGPAFGVPLGVSAPEVTTIAAADFDGDGLLDLAVTIGTIVPSTFPVGNFQIAVLSGKGNGAFSAIHSTAGLMTSEVAVDMNKDGIPDLVGNLNAGFAGGGLSVFLGNGDGTFQPGVLLQPGESTFAIADFNRDGAPDLAALNVAGIATFLNLSQPPAALTVVSAASFASGSLAPNSIATAFGEHLALSTIAITDSAGITRNAPLFFGSPDQINFLVPAVTALGPATISVSGAALAKPVTAQAQIAAIAPSIFTTGGNIAAAYAVQVAPGGLQTTLPSSMPIDLSQPGQVYLILFGTGFDSASAATTAVTIQGINAPVTYAGTQPAFPGLDQINLLLPPLLSGTGVASLEVVINGQAANRTLVNIQ